MQTVTAFSPECFWHPLLWALITGAVHLLGMTTFQLDVYVQVDKGIQPNPSLRHRFESWIQDEFVPCAYQSKTSIVYKSETYSFAFMSWIAALATLAHFVYGTLVFSSTLFISSQDAVTVLVRFLTSTLCCRAILVYELNGMRQASEAGMAQ